MKPSSFARATLILFLFLTGCGTPPVQAPTPTAVPATRAPDPAIITPENADRLVQVGLLGMGQAFGRPLYSPDGKSLFQATTTGVYVFDPGSSSNGRLLAPYATTPYQDELMALSPDGKTLAIGGDLVMVESGQRLPELAALPASDEILAVDQVAFSPDGSLMGRGYIDTQTGGSRLLAIWRLADGRLLHTFALKGDYYSFSFSMDAKLLSLARNGTDGPIVELYDLPSGGLIVSRPGERSVFLPDQRLAVVSQGTVRIFDLTNGQAKHAFYGYSAAFSPDGERIVLLNFDRFKIYNLADEKQIGTLDGDFTDLGQAVLSFSPDGASLAGATSRRNICCGIPEETLSLWRAADGVLLKKIDHSSALFSFSPDAKALAITAPTGSTEIRDAGDGALRSSLGRYYYSLSAVSFLPNSQELVIASAADNSEHDMSIPGDYQSPLFFYAVGGGDLTRYQPEMEQNATLALSTDGKVYAPDDLRDLPQIYEAPGDVTSIAFSPDGKKVAVSYPGGFYLWDLPEKQLLLHAPICSYGDSTSLAFSPDGEQLARPCDVTMPGRPQPTIQVWDAAAQGKLLREIQLTYAVSMVTYSPDGRFIAAGGDQVGVWSAADGSPLFSIPEAVTDWGNGFGTLGVQSLAFSPNGRILAINPKNGPVELLAVESGQKIRALAGTGSDDDPVKDLDFSPDGKLLAVGLEYGGALIFGVK